MTSKYKRLEELGKGAYATVYRAKDTSTGNQVALKVVRINNSEGLPPTTIREIALVKELKHTNIIAIYDAIGVGNEFYIAFELCDQDLRKYMDTDGKWGALGPAKVREFMGQLLAGINHCHENRVIHRDLKPQNLLINKKGELKIGDFGLARAIGLPVHKFSNNVVTLWYRAPDVILGSRTYSTSIDIWSCGCIFAEMISGVPLFWGRDDQDQQQLFRIMQIIGTPDVYTLRAYWPEVVIKQFPRYPKIPFQQVLPKASPQAIDLLERLLQFDPSRRITAAEALSHPYFTHPPATTSVHMPLPYYIRQLQLQQKTQHHLPTNPYCRLVTRAGM